MCHYYQRAKARGHENFCLRTYIHPNSQGGGGAAEAGGGGAAAAAAAGNVLSDEMEEEEQEEVLHVDEVEIQASEHGPLGDDSVVESIGLCTVYVWGPTERERDREKGIDRDTVAIVCAKCVCGVCVDRDRKIERGRASENVCTCVLFCL
jgi:hypothetical protein